VEFDAFISYSHAVDKALAGALQRGLQRFAKPIYRLRAMHVFRDESTLALTPGLWPEIQKAIESSRYFILLADPLAAASQWVQKEILYWLQLGRAQRLLIVWTGGELFWDTSARDFDWTRTDALPKQLSGAFEEEPLYLDLRWAKREEQLTLAHQEFGRAVAQIAAPIRGMNLDQIFGEDVRQHRRNRLIAAVGIAAVMLMAMFAGWRWFLEAEARRTAQTRLAQTIHERSLVESEEHDRQAAALLLAAQASASAPARDALRNVYRLRALHLTLTEPQAVHQLGRPVRWAMMPSVERWVTFSQLPWLEVWDTRQWRRIRQINVDPQKLPVTGVSPYCACGDGQTFEVVAHEAVDQEATRGSGWNNFQQWDLETGALRASEREISYKSYQDWIGTGLPSRNPVSVDEVEQLRRGKSDFGAVLVALARLPIDTLKDRRYLDSFSQIPPPTESSRSWWVDALEPTGEFLVATYYTKEIPWNGTWNGAIKPPLDHEDVTAVWQWNGTTYQKQWELKERWSPQFHRSAGFGRADGRVLLWVLRADGTLVITDAGTGKVVRPPMALTSRA